MEFRKILPFLAKKRLSPLSDSLLPLNLYNRGFYRLDGRQEIRQQFPGISGVAGVEDLSRIRAEINAGIFEGIRRHRFPQNIHIGAFGQSIRQAMPGIAGIAAAPHSEFSIYTYVEFIAFLRDHIDRFWVGGMDRDRESEAGWQFALADVNPVLAGIVAAINSAVILLIEHVWIGRVHCHLMHALPIFGKFFGMKIGADILIERIPRFPAVIRAVAASR